MRILVYDVAAEDGGGLFVLENFYNEVVSSQIGKANIEWIFITSYNILKSTKTVKVFYYEWVKKSWIHRLYFEEVVIQKIIKKLKIEKIISLQNTTIKHCNLEQYVYLHQSLQYCPKKFSLFKSQERNLAIRQKFICNMYRTGLKKAKHIYVQTQWIKKETVKWLSCESNKISVVPVLLSENNHIKKESCSLNNKVFFYPARAEVYKNHEIIIKACQILKKQNLKNYKVLFTINQDDNTYSKYIRKLSKNLPIEFIGNISYANVWDYYENFIMLFPSYLETCGLPLLEARKVGTYILASDMLFSHEALDDYENKSFFNYLNAQQLAEKMKDIVQGKKPVKRIEVNEQIHSDSSLLNNILADMFSR